MVNSSKVVNIIMHDNKKLFVSLLENNHDILNCKVGNFPLLSVAVLFNAKKIEKYLFARYPRYFVTCDMDENVEQEFLNLAKGRASIVYQKNNDDLVEPNEIYFLQKKYFQQLRFENLYRQNNAKIPKLMLATKNEDIIFDNKNCRTEITTNYLMRRQFKIIALFFLCLVCGITFFWGGHVVAEKSLAKIVFDAGAGSSVGYKYVFKNAKYSLPKAKKTGYSFVGWYIDEALTRPFEATKITNESVFLYAKYQINTYTISFLTPQGSNVENVSVVYNQNYTLNETSSKTNCQFYGWKYGNKIITNLTMPPKNVVLTAIYRDGSANLPYLLNGQTDIEFLKNNPTAHFVMNSDLTLNDFNTFDNFSGCIKGTNKTLTLTSQFAKSMSGTLEKIKFDFGTMSVVCEKDFGLICNTNSGNISFCEVNGSLTATEAVATQIKVGMLCGENEGTIDNSTVEGSLSVSSDFIDDCWVGGIAGLNKGNITNCVNRSNITTNTDVGGVCGKNTKTIEYCNNFGNVTCTNNLTYDDTKSWASFVGGVVAIFTDESASLTNCKNEGIIIGKSDNYEIMVGGIAGGREFLTGGYIIIENCINKGSVSAYAYNKRAATAGGIVGNATRLKINKCSNSAEIYAEAVDDASFASGIVAFAQSVNVNLSVNHASITAKSTKYSAYASGILGFGTNPSPYLNGPYHIFYNDDKPSVENCYNTGNISAHTDAQPESAVSVLGGLVGRMYGNLKNCYSTGKILGETNDWKGGLWGYFNDVRAFTNPYYDYETYYNAERYCNVENCHWLYYETGTATNGLASSDDTANMLKYTDIGVMFEIADTLGSENFIRQDDDTPKLMWE